MARIRARQHALHQQKTGRLRRNRAIALAILACLFVAANGPRATAATAAIAVPDGAYAEVVPHDGAPRVRARLLVHPDDRLPADRVRLGVLFELDPGWHIYARDPGDSGIPTKLSWRIDGARTGPIAWPQHEVFSEADGLLATNGYSKEVLLATTATFESPATAGRPLRVDVEALACLVECIPVEFSLERPLPTAGESAATADPVRALFQQYAGSLSAHQGGPSEPAATSLLALLGLAFLGGLVLNAMPCVLPVLAIKLFALAELAQRSRREVIANTAAYGLGVLSTLLLLAGFVAGLRAAGTAVGWGFQFQEPVFVAAVATVLVVFALNLFGAFEFRWSGGALADVGAGAVGARRSFFEGLLVVVLATPCSAPFLGTAVGIAFASPAPVIFAVFAAIAVGLAAPYLLIALSPRLARFVPRSGPWMLQLRTGLGFLLLATTVWLVWIFGRSVGTDAVAQLLALLVVIAFVVWLHGTLQRLGRPRLSLSTGLAAIALIGFGLNGIRTEFSDGPPAQIPAADEQWAPYDPAQIAEQLAAGHSVFVAFTADWCITCKLNEHRVLSNARVVDAFSRLDIARFEADWTRRDERIRRELERFGRAGVPMYLVYHPEAPDQPALLPELLSIETVITAISAPRRPANVTADTPSESHPSM